MRTASKVSYLGLFIASTLFAAVVAARIRDDEFALRGGKRYRLKVRVSPATLFAAAAIPGHRYSWGTLVDFDASSGTATIEVLQAAPGVQVLKRDAALLNVGGAELRLLSVEELP